MVESYGVALAGGGSKGAYEFGAWKALRELDVPICAVTGASIGALNGAMIAQGNFRGAEELWTTVDYAHCVALPAAVDLKSSALLSPRNIGVMKEILLNNGLDTSPFRALVGKYVDERAVADSPIDFGLVTFSMTDLRSVERWKSEIPRGQLADYIMASTRYPGLRKVSIDGKEFIDGGVGDNLPVAMLRRRGLRHVIAIDIRGGAIKRSLETQNMRLVHIRNKVDLGSAFDLTPALVRTNLQLGWLDTMTAFGVLDGEYYYFKHGEYQALRRDFGCDGLVELERAAMAFGLDRARVYPGDEFLDLLSARLEEGAQTPGARRLAEAELLEAARGASRLKGLPRVNLLRRRPPAKAAQD